MQKYHIEPGSFIKKGAMFPMLIAIIIAIIINSFVAYVTVLNGASSSFHPLTPQYYGVFTILGFIAGWIGWRIVELNAKQPKRTLQVLVPALTILSFAPDILLVFTPLIPETSNPGALALMTMHLVVVICAVPSFVLASKKFAH